MEFVEREVVKKGMYQKYLQLLEKTGKTTYQVCKDTGIPESTISMWKNRGSGLSVKNLAVLAKYFGVQIEYFIEEEK